MQVTPRSTTTHPQDLMVLRGVFNVLGVKQDSTPWTRLAGNATTAKGAALLLWVIGPFFRVPGEPRSNCVSSCSRSFARRSSEQKWRICPAPTSTTRAASISDCGRHRVWLHHYTEDGFFRPKAVRGKGLNELGIQVIDTAVYTYQFKPQQKTGC